ncbi:hypothetical protein ACSMXN_05300 [Jatrophihabitans sp. DSM 45814]
MKRARVSYNRFQAGLPNETSHQTFTRYRIADRTEAEIITWLDDQSRYILRCSARRPVTDKVAQATFRATVATYAIPPSTPAAQRHALYRPLPTGRG